MPCPAPSRSSLRPLLATLLPLLAGGPVLGNPPGDPPAQARGEAAPPAGDGASSGAARPASPSRNRPGSPRGTSARPASPRRSRAESDPSRPARPDFLALPGKQDEPPPSLGISGQAGPLVLDLSQAGRMETKARLLPDRPGTLAVESKASGPKIGPRFRPLANLLTREATFQFTTRDPRGRTTAWMGTRDDILGAASLVGIHTATGKMTAVDLGAFGGTHLVLAPGADGAIYAWTGAPARFVRIDPELGRPEALGDAQWLDTLRQHLPRDPHLFDSVGDLTPDHWFLVALNPGAVLVACDTRTGDTRFAGSLADTKAIRPHARDLKTDAGGVAYCVVQGRRWDVVAYDLATGLTRVVLEGPPEGKAGAPPALFRAGDGRVYAEAGAGEETLFLCRPDRCLPVTGERPQAPSQALEVDGRVLAGLDPQGDLVLTDPGTGKASRIPTEYPGRRLQIHALLGERDGKVYGTALSPLKLFQWDTAARELTFLEDWPHLTTCAFPTAKGLILASDPDARVDWFDPSQPFVPGVNPRCLGSAPGWRAPKAFCQGPDGRLYAGINPTLRGQSCALLRVDPEALTTEVIPLGIDGVNLEFVESLGGIGELFCTTSVARTSGGAALCFHWDLKDQRVKRWVRPLEVEGSLGTRHVLGYGRVVRAENGRIYGVGWGRRNNLAFADWFAYDPAKRATVADGPLGYHLEGNHLNRVPVRLGERELMVGMSDGRVFTLDPRKHERRDLEWEYLEGRNPEERQRRTGIHTFLAGPDGTLYTGGAAGTLSACSLPALWQAVNGPVARRPAPLRPAGSRGAK